MSNPVQSYTDITEYDIELFKGGYHNKLYQKLGAHRKEINGQQGFYFAVWAPSASKVAVVGNFNHWDENAHQLHVRWDQSGIWEGFIPHIDAGENYKFKIWSHINNTVLEKADPYAFWAETPSLTASITYQSKYQWNDEAWMEKRTNQNALDAPWSVYEVHLGSWRKTTDNKYLTYRELANQLVEYVIEMGFTHVEFLPVMEHPFDPSWGYQVTSYFAPSSRFGTPDDFKYLIDQMHNAGIGVILDWVPAHFPSDEWALSRFDGSYLYEHPDVRKGYHPDWKSLIFNFERPEVRSFLKSSAIYWLDQFHIDGLRVDAVASMLYLDYSREEGEWEPNIYGGNENLAAIDFLKELNTEVYLQFPDVQMIAEESTSFQGVTTPVHQGGLGFGMKWMMGWMNDVLNYFSKDPIYRRHHQDDITFSLNYAYSENFMLPLSHDEVVHGKRSMPYKMPGDEWQRMANVKVLFGWMFAHPGTNLLFMGNEIGQTSEWQHFQSLDWHLLEYAPHQGVQQFVKALNQLYTEHPAMYKEQFDPSGFQWIDQSDSQQSILVFLRQAKDCDPMLFIINLTPTPHHNYRIGCPDYDQWEVVLNSDESQYFGSEFTKVKSYTAANHPYHHRSKSMEIDIPPMSVICLMPD